MAMVNQGLAQPETEINKLHEQVTQISLQLLHWGRLENRKRSRGTFRPM
jgi:hypothetical protein